MIFHHRDGSSGPVLSWDLSLPDETGDKLSDVARHNVEPCTAQGKVFEVSVVNMIFTVSW